MALPFGMVSSPDPLFRLLPGGRRALLLLSSVAAKLGAKRSTVDGLNYCLNHRIGNMDYSDDVSVHEKLMNNYFLFRYTFSKLFIFFSLLVYAFS